MFLVHLTPSMAGPRRRSQTVANQDGISGRGGLELFDFYPLSFSDFILSRMEGSVSSFYSIDNLLSKKSDPGPSSPTVSTKQENTDSDGRSSEAEDDSNDWFKNMFFRPKPEESAEILNSPEIQSKYFYLESSRMHIGILERNSKSIIVTTLYTCFPICIV